MALSPNVIFYWAMMRPVPPFRKQTRVAIGPRKMNDRADGLCVGNVRREIGY
jgi:hypothetical protein